MKRIVEEGGPAAAPVGSSTSKEDGWRRWRASRAIEHGK